MYSSSQSCCNWGRWGMMVLTILVPVVAIGVLLTGGMVVGRSMAQSDTDKRLRHVVMFKFKETSSPAEIAQVVEAFRLLPAKISEMAEFEFGTNNSPEGLENGFTHCFLVTFKSEKDRQVYLTHPAHNQFIDVLKPHLDKVQVIDYWAGK